MKAAWAGASRDVGHNMRHGFVWVKISLRFGNKCGYFFFRGWKFVNFEQDCLRAKGRGFGIGWMAGCNVIHTDRVGDDLIGAPFFFVVRYLTYVVY